MDNLLTLAAVFLGWALSEFGASRRLSGENRRAVGPVLRDLLEIRRRLIAIDGAMGELKKQIPIPTGSELQLKQIISKVVPEAPGFAERYEKAVSLVARADPLLAFRLGGQPMVGMLPGWLRDLAASEEAASKFWVASGEQQLSGLLRPHLDELILAVASAHGQLTKWRTKRYLKKPPGLPPDVQEKLSVFFAELKKHAPSPPIDRDDHRNQAEDQQSSTPNEML